MSNFFQQPALYHFFNHHLAQVPAEGNAGTRNEQLVPDDFEKVVFEEVKGE